MFSLLKKSFLRILIQYVTSSSLHLTVISEQATLERDVFLNLGQTRNLTVDLAGSTATQPNLTDLASLANPATKYTVGIPNSVFLLDLKLGNKAFPCTCSNIG